MHFLLIGAGLFLLFGLRNGPASLSGNQAGPDSARIVVTQNDIEQLAGTFTRTWLREPTDEELQGLIESFVRDEIYFREARAIGLDRDDNVIRRRLRMKMEYIFEDIASQGVPTEEELETYFRINSARYLNEPRIAFNHVFVSSDKRGDNAESYALHLLTELNTGNAPEPIGDLLLLEPVIPLSSLKDIESQFGKRFGKHLMELEPGKWAGPVRSEFGLHLVMVTDRREERLPELSEVAERVKADLAMERQEELKNAAYEKLRQRYTVMVEKPTPVTAEVAQAEGTEAPR